MKPKVTVSAKTRAAIIPWMLEVGNRVYPAVSPVYRLDHQRRLELVGSSLLLKLGDYHVAATAAHVLDHASGEPIGLGGDESIVQLDGRYFQTTPPAGGSRTQDRFDLGFYEISANNLSLFKQARFLEIDDIERSERPNLTRPFGSKYFVIGFPCSRQQKVAATELTRPRPLMVAVLPQRPSAYERIGASQHAHIALELDRKSVNGAASRLTAPSLHGMSGGGVWSASTLFEAGSSERLVGVITEYHAGSHKTLLATRIDVLIDGLHKVLGINA